MRILYIGDSDNTLLQRYAAFMRDQGHDIHILHSGMQKYRVQRSNELSGINVIELKEIQSSFRGVSLINNIFQLRKTVRSVSPDIIHLHSLPSLARAACFLDFHPLVFTPWGNDVLSLPFHSSLEMFRTKLSLRRIDAIIAQSNCMIGETLKFSGPVKNCYNIHWGADLNKFKGNVDTTALRQSLNIDIDSKIILSPRQLGHKYNIQTLIKSLPKIISEIENVVLILKYYIVQDNLELELKKLVADLKVEDHVRFIGRNESPGESHDTMPLYYNLSDAWVSIPSWDGGTPATMAEAFACDTFPIVSNIPTNTEWVTNNFNGLVLEEIQADLLAESAIRAIQDKTFRDTVIERNQSLVRFKGDFNREMLKVEDAYNEIIDDTK